MSDDAKPEALDRPSKQELSQTLLSPDDHTESHPPTLTRAKRKGVGWFGLLPTAFVVVVSLGLGSTLLLWLLTHQVHELQDGMMAAIRNGTFYIDEGSKKAADGSSTSSMQVLTFSSVAVSLGPVNTRSATNGFPLQSSLIAVTSSFLMTLVAFRIGGKMRRGDKDRIGVASNVPLQHNGLRTQNQDKNTW